MPGPYPTRTKTYAPGDQVGSAELNAIQDGIIDCSDEIGDIEDNELPPRLKSVTCTGNQSDVPAPDTTGAIEIWVEMSTNGTNEVILDVYAHADWRDRYIHVVGYAAAATAIAGGANDDVIDYSHEPVTDSASVEAFWYSRDGSAAGGSPHCQFQPAAWAVEYVNIYARSIDGSLVMKKDAHAVDPDTFIVLKITGSPIQHHYV